MQRRNKQLLLFALSFIAALAISLAQPSRAGLAVRGDGAVPELLGAVGDGNHDDTAALQATLDTYGVAFLSHGKTYKITRKLLLTQSGQALIGDGSATIYMPATAFNNRSLRSADRYDDNAVGIGASGLTRAPFTTIEKITLRGFKLKGDGADGRVVAGIVARNIKDLSIEDVEVTEFPLAVGIRVASITGESKISGNYIHNFSDNRNWGSGPPPQITGIEIDNDPTNGVASVGLKISENKIVDLTVGPRFLAAHGYQTDGVNVLRADSRNLWITNNEISNVGEGIDHFGSFSVIADNTITDAYIFGIKLVHGASSNLVRSNIIDKVGLAGIVLGSARGDLQTTAHNEIASNDISSVDPLGVWKGSAATSCIRTWDSDDPEHKTRDNRIKKNVCDPGAGKFAFSRVGKGSNVWEANTFKSGVVGAFYDQ